MTIKANQVSEEPTTVSEDLRNMKDNSTSTEAETTDSEMNIYDELKQLNCFKNTTNMAKVMEGQKGGGFYAAIIQDRGTKNSQIGVVIEYPDGEESELIKFSQGEYLQAGLKKFEQVKKGGGTTKLPFAQKFEDKLMEYMSPRMPIWPEVVMRTIYEMYNKLPVIKVFEKAPGIEEIYKCLSLAAVNLSLEENKGYVNHKDYYRFKLEDFGKVADELGLTVKLLVDKLNQYGLFNCTPSSIGFQTKIKFNNQYFYTYNVCKHSNAMQLDVQKNVDGEFPTRKFDRKYLSASELLKLQRKEKEEEYVAKLGIKNFIAASLAQEYGIGNKIPFEFEEVSSS